MSSVPGRNGGNRTGDQKSVGEGIAPTKPNLSPAASAWWDWFLPLLPERALSRIDAIQLMFLANFLADADNLERKMREQPNDLATRRLYGQTFEKIHKLAAVFGLNPPDRARIGFDSIEEQTDPFLEFLEMSRQANNAN